ncbi:antitoxin [Chitinophaga terrae (ex Kim and Jung 2007)]|nr:antitoxin [Chitinophaga terrae (ex Kim and Jung 2007)]
MFVRKKVRNLVRKNKQMRVVNYSEFRNHLAENLNAVNDDKEIVVVSRVQGKNVVVMDLDEYNSIQETLHLLSTKANRKRLEESIQEMAKGKSAKHKLIEK